MSKQTADVALFLTHEEALLVIEALQHRAARHEGMARARPQAAKPHDKKALAMRKLAAFVANERWNA